MLVLPRNLHVQQVLNTSEDMSRANDFLFTLRLAIRQYSELAKRRGCSKDEAVTEFVAHVREVCSSDMLAPIYDLSLEQDCLNTKVLTIICHKLIFIK